MLSPAERSLIEQLARRVAALERSPVQGQGVGSLYGGTQVRTVQLGFPAVLTSVWDSSTGYDWDRQTVAGVTVDDPNLPISGSYAVTPGNDETLPSGTRGWMEPAPDGSPAWVFVPEGVGGLTTMTVVTDACLSGDPPVLKLTKRNVYFPSAWPVGAAYCEVDTGCADPCGGGSGVTVTVDCCEEPIPARLWACVTGCDDLNGLFPVDHVGGAQWVGTLPTGQTIELACDESLDWGVTLRAVGGAASYPLEPLAGVVCDPFSGVSGPTTASGLGDCNGTLVVTITAAEPTDCGAVDPGEPSCCTTELTGHPDITVTVYGGGDEGSYTAEWNGSTGWAFTTPVTGECLLRCDAVIGEYGPWLIDVPGTSGYCDNTTAACTPSVTADWSAITSSALFADSYGITMSYTPP